MQCDALLQVSFMEANWVRLSRAAYRQMIRGVLAEDSGAGRRSRWLNLYWTFKINVCLNTFSKCQIVIK